MLGSKLDILKQDWIDVVFSNRNKAYGAYELRKDNAKNTTKALIIAIALFVFFIALPTIINAIQGFIPKADTKVKMTDVVLLPPPPVSNKVKPPPPPAQEPARARENTVKFPPMVVKPDNEVKEKDPPTVKELAVADPGQKDVKGDPNADIHIDAPVGNADAHAVVDEDPNQVYQTVEQLPEFPGGDDAFGEYLRKTIRYPGLASENGVQGTVLVTFVCEKDGSLTDIKVVRGIGSGCDEEAIRALKKSPKWRPGRQNGKYVRVQYSVPVRFQLPD